MKNKDLGLIVWLLSVSVWAFAQTTGSPCTSNCVYPGDANNDHIVNKSDVLAVGLTYGFTGPSRQNSSSNFIPQNCALWNGNIPGSNIDSKYTDCNGNGTVEAHDFDAIWLNYGQSHQYTPPSNGGNNLPTNGVEVRIVFDEDSLEVNDNGGSQVNNFEAEIRLGNANTPASDLYGLAFSIKYDPALFGNIPLSVSYDSNWFGSSSATKMLKIDDRANGQLDIALTRLNHQAANGNGRVLKIQGGVIGENIHGRNLRRYLKFDVIGIEATNAVGMPQSLIGVSDSLLLAGTAFTATSNKLDAVPFSISPNPISASQNLNILGLNTAYTYTISDILGRVLRNERNTTLYTIPTDDLQTGSYLITITTDKGTTTKPFFIK